MTLLRALRCLNLEDVSFGCVHTKYFVYVFVFCFNCGQFLVQQRA